MEENLDLQTILQIRRFGSALFTTSWRWGVCVRQATPSRPLCRPNAPLLSLTRTRTPNATSLRGEGFSTPGLMAICTCAPCSHRSKIND